MPDGRDGRVVLIVQEEFLLRMDVADAFEAVAFKIFQASTADEASSFSNANQRSVWCSPTSTCRARRMAWRSHTISAVGGRRRSFWSAPRVSRERRYLLKRTSCSSLIWTAGSLKP